MLWFWGLLGAFIYAGPRWARCWVVHGEAGHSKVECFIDFAIALVTGAIAGAAFTSILLTYTGLKDQNAVSALVGVFVNPVAPELTKRAPKVIGKALGVFNDLKGDGK